MVLETVDVSRAHLQGRLYKGKKKNSAKLGKFVIRRRWEGILKTETAE